MAPPLSDHELLERLVSFDSTSARSNRPIADFCRAYLEEGGERLRVVEHRYERDGVEKVNLVAWIGGDDSSESDTGLALSGHLDVVPPESEGWESPPFTLTERDGRWYGRGSCDMKGFVALALSAMRRRAVDEPPPHCLMLILCADEEVGSVGAAQLVDNWPAAAPRPPRSVLIGEPTSLRAVRLHKGHLKLRITVEGRAAHSGFPHLGVNANEAAGRIVSALSGYREELEAARVDSSDSFPETPFPAINVARISGGGAINVIPDSAEIDVGVRLLPGMASEPVIEMVRGMVERAAAPAKGSVSIINDSPPMLTDEAAPLYRAISGLVGQRESVGVPFASDAGAFSRVLGLECVLFGPGSIDVAHRPNEYLPIEEFKRGRELVDRLIGEFTNEAQDGRHGEG